MYETLRSIVSQFCRIWRPIVKKISPAFANAIADSVKDTLLQHSPPKRSPAKTITGSFDSLSFSDEPTNLSTRSRTGMSHGKIDSEKEEARHNTDLTAAERTLGRLTDISFPHNFNLTQGESGQLTCIDIDCMTKLDIDVKYPLSSQIRSKSSHYFFILFWIKRTSLNFCSG